MQDVLQRTLTPEDGNTAWAAGLVFLKKGNVDPAIQMLERATNLDPLNGLIELDLAIAYFEKGKPKSALPHLQKAVTMASQGRIREYRTVATEAAFLAVRHSLHTDFTPQQSLACRVRARQWLQDELNRLDKLLRSDNPLNQSGAKQSIERMFAGSNLDELRQYMNSSLLSESELNSWDDFREKVNSLLNDANKMKLSTIDKRTSDFLLYFNKVEIEKNRRIAEWVFSHGGQVLIRPDAELWFDKKITTVNQIPIDAFAIRGISFRDAPMTDEVLRELEPIPELWCLHLEGTLITDDAIPWIIQHFPGLQALNLDRNKVTNTALANLKSIQFLSFRDTKLSSAEIDEFLESRQKLEGNIVLRNDGDYATTNPDQDKSSISKCALRFDGIHSFDTGITRNSLLPTTIEAWVYYPSNMVTRYSFPVIGRSKSVLTSMLGMNLYRRSIRGESREGEKSIFNTTTTKIAIETWTHIAIVFDGQQMRCFVDGKLIDSVRFTMVPGQLFYRVGGTDNGREFEGDLDEVRISSTARYTADFKPALRHEPDEFTLALYHFDEGEGAIAHDASGNGYDLQLTGTTWVQRDE